MGDYISLDEETFDEIFQLIPNPDDDDCKWESWQIEACNVIENRVWTIVEGDSGNGLYLLPGWHSANVFGYAVSTIGWSMDQEYTLEGIYMEPQPTCDRCGERQDAMAVADWCGDCGTCRDCCGHSDDMCEAFFMAGAQCILKRGHDGHHNSGE